MKNLNNIIIITMYFYVVKQYGETHDLKISIISCCVSIEKPFIMSVIFMKILHCLKSLIQSYIIFAYQTF